EVPVDRREIETRADRRPEPVEEMLLVAEQDRDPVAGAETERAKPPRDPARALVELAIRDGDALVREDQRRLVGMPVRARADVHAPFLAGVEERRLRFRPASRRFDSMRGP